MREAGLRNVPVYCAALTVDEGVAAYGSFRNPAASEFQSFGKAGRERLPNPLIACI
jgi:hypothetical protein